ncbi:MAG: hypothetical protein QOI55_2896, partial [Actinomycetota bacterium]|nr:hypothetical protein [Actinomycetota bacterium]
GGGSWNVPCSPGEHVDGEPATVMTVDVVEWCHLFSDRIDADVLPVEVAGDRDLVADVVVAAPTFAAL